MLGHINTNFQGCNTQDKRRIQIHARSSFSPSSSPKPSAKAFSPTRDNSSTWSFIMDPSGDTWLEQSIILVFNVVRLKMSIALVLQFFFQVSLSTQDSS